MRKITRRCMKIIVKTQPNSSENSVILVKQPTLNFGLEESHLPVYKVKVTEIPSAGRANQAVTNLLAEHFSVSKSRVQLVGGKTSKQKTYIIDL